jgi:hypothetical protein
MSGLLRQLLKLEPEATEGDLLAAAIGLGTTQGMDALQTLSLERIASALERLADAREAREAGSAQGAPQ